VGWDRLPPGWVLEGERPVLKGEVDEKTRRNPKPARAEAEFDPRHVPPPLPIYLARKLGPEQQFQALVIREMRPRLVDGAVLTPLNGELPGGRGGKEYRFLNAQMIRRIMGYQPGTPDLEAKRPGFTGVLELKRARGDADLYGKRTSAGSLSPEQR